MNRNRGRGRARNTRDFTSPRGAGDSGNRRSSLGADRPAEDFLGGEDGLSISKSENVQQMPVSSALKHSENKQNTASPDLEECLSNLRISHDGVNSPDGEGSRSKQSKYLLSSDSMYSGSEGLDVGRIQIGGTADIRTSPDDLSLKVTISGQHGEVQFPTSSDKKDGAFPIKSPALHPNPEHSGHSAVLVPFDICTPKNLCSVALKPPLLVRNRERRNEMKRAMEGLNGTLLRSGMILLKSHISISDQVAIVTKCRKLGLGPGGFYQPGYRDGAKLQLKMMCLGKNWDPETRKYGDERSFDNAKPPIIPAEFHQLVEKAIKDSHSLIQKNSKATNVEDILPWMSPNICLVNFYSANGRLGLHQDRDESRESLYKGLPVVSFSIGDSADFLYGDQRDVDKAEKVVLESGDVLIFGGTSRNIFHGVSAIHQNTAPKALLEETNLSSGRLNLTFRES